jgi:hypothetical protein
MQELITVFSFPTNADLLQVIIRRNKFKLLSSHDDRNALKKILNGGFPIFLKGKNLKILISAFKGTVG